MMNNLIDTAIPIENDLEQPLITTYIDASTDDAPIDSNEKQKKTWFRTHLQFINGFWLGFIIQTVSLGSTAIIAIHWGDPDSWVVSKQDEPYYAIFFILSQSWWLLFPVICIAIDGSLTGNRQVLFEKFFFPSSSSSSSVYTNDDSNDNDDNDNSNSNGNDNETNDYDNNTSAVVSSREVFLGGVKFHVGIVFGCFLVWTIVDMYFDASFDVFTALLASLITCLGLCYGMVIIHDRFIINNNIEEQEQQYAE
mmetsp:Transcript_67940/g.76065  ORF Transcript_67940/g.76065 Transcript_67940/m.76065 type:complete len:252 (+) Transcript_67940:66-821(+)